MNALTGLRRLVCCHSETTAEDGEGHAICSKCSAPVAVRLTLPMLERGIDAIRNQKRPA